MKKQISQRLVSMLLVLVMLLGLIPGTMSTRTEAVTPEEQTTAEGLLDRIKTMETDPRYSKYVAHGTSFHQSGDKYILDNAKAFFEGLDGKYIFVNREPINGSYYALDPTNPVCYSHYALDPVTIVGDQVFGAGAGTVIELRRDTGAKNANNENDWYYPTNATLTSARARYFLKTVEGKYIKLLDGSDASLTATNRENGLQQTPEGKKVSTTIHAWPIGTGGGVFVFNSGIFRDTQRTGLAFEPSTLTAYTKYTGDYTTEHFTVISLYRERTDRVNTEPLYDAIVEAKAYVNNCNPYEEKHYSSFLTALENALNTYSTYNVDSYSGDVAEAESTVNDLAQVLRDATTLIKPYNEQIKELLVPKMEQLSTADEVKEGTYFIMAMDRNGFYATYDPNATGAFTQGQKVFNKLIYLPVADGQVIADSLLGSSTFKTYGNLYSLILSNGQHLRLLNNDNTLANDHPDKNMEDITYGNPYLINVYERISYGTNNAYNRNPFADQPNAFLVSNSSASSRLWVSMSNNRRFFQTWRSTTAPTEGGDEYDMYLFRISDVTLELFKALKYMEPYGVGNGDNRYDKSAYDAFAAKVSEALKEYRANRDNLSDPAKQKDLDDLAAELKTHAAKLTVVDSQAEYIDIPMELMDFRSDKLLFEFYSSTEGSRYALATARNTPGFEDVYNTFMDKTHSYSGTNTGTTVRTGSTLNTLVDGELYYAEHTIAYIAAVMMTEWTIDKNHPTYNMTNSSKQTYGSLVETFNQSMEGTDWQDAFIKKVEELYTVYNSTESTPEQKAAVLGSFGETIKKTKGKKNGGLLLWEQVETAHDLSYYLLNNLWRPVPAEDILNKEEVLKNGAEPEHYNTVITDRDTLRLYYDPTTKMYTLDADNHVVADGYTVMNAVPQVNANLGLYPHMMPADGLGFEKNGNETDPSTYRVQNDGYGYGMEDSNFGFTLHASGSFVYYEDQEQILSFTGDDDVYFFVNNKLVVDLGGTHSATGHDRIDLRELNQDPELNLGLEDGGVYSFDMFYAERHTNGSNMKFATNINIVSTDTMTTKGQYAVEVKGNSTIGPDGKGGEMIDNQILNIGDVVAYSFNLDNTRTTPVVDLEFHDPSLGVHLTKDGIEQYNVTLENGTKTLSLTNPETGYGNGVATRFADLILEYIPYDEDGNRASGTPTELTPAQMATMIRETVTLPDNSLEYHYDSLPTTVYRVRVSNESELMDLLAAGVPKKCYFSIYGFLRKTVSEDVPYVNELTTHCSYRRSANISAEFATITGKASRFLRVPEATDMPDIPRIEAVLDYGKAVQIPIADFTNQFFFEKDGEASVGQVVGFVEKGYNGQLLKAKPKTLLCANTDETAKGTHGIFTRKADVLEYAMGEFMESVELLYAVVQVNNFVNAGVQYEYALVELRLIPANMMYYEAEDFAGAGSEISYVQVGGSYPNWKIEDDKKGSSDYQDFDPAGYRTYDMVADRDNIPAEAFFADFDGKGYVDRYRTQPQYKGYDFDEYYTTDPETGTVTGKLYAKNWVVNTANGPYAEIDHKVGTLSFGLHEGTDSVYVQSGRDLRGKSEGFLELIPGEENVAQIRFKVENLELDTEKELPQIRLYYTDHDSTREDKIQSDSVTFPAEYLDNERYYTATIPLSEERYGSEPLIDRIRVQLFNVKSKAGGRMTIDYIYVGPVSGMKQNIYDDYLYFTFDNTAADQLRYKGSQYGSTASAIRNYDTTDYWKAVPPKNACSISGGCIVLTDNTDSEKSKYNSIHAGSNDEEAPFTYRLTGNDVYRIRFKITPKAGETIQRDPGDKDQDPYIALEVGKNGIPAACLSFPLERYTDGEFHTLTLPANTANLANNNISVLKYIRPTFSYIKGAVYTIDYIYVGPSNLADEVTGKADHIFFDFTNNDAAKSRYSNPVYGTTGTNFDTEKWAVNTTTTGAPVYSSTNSTMSVSPKAGTTVDTFPVVLSQTGQLAGPYPLAYKPTGKDYFKIQMKITGASDTDVGFRLRYSDASSGGNSSTESTFDCRIPASAVSSEKFFVLEGYVGFGESKVVTSIRPEVYDLTVKSGETVTITYDYIYIGPLTDQKVTTDNLYFGFDNTPEDQARYANYTYGGYNFDEADTYSPYGIGQWATSYVINEINYDYTIDNKKGLLNIGVTDGFTGTVEANNQMYGPTLVTTDRYGEYGVNANTSILRYRPNNASVAQLRFRLKNCQVAEKKTPRVVFLFGGYNADGAYVTFSNMSSMVQSFTPEDGFITLSIPLHQGFRDLALVTNIGFRIQHIYSPDDTGVVELDYFYVGTGEGAPDTYGYDSSYNTANLYSNGVSLYTEGNGVRTDANPNPAKYTETRFSFTGTGFDLISRTDPNQATIRVEIYTDDSYSKDSRISNTAVNLKGELDLYQIPVYSKHGLPYGTYYVSVMVNGAVNFPAIPALSRGNQFFLDAIRIYDPIDVTQGKAAPTGSDSAVAYVAYCADVEAHVIVKEVREILLSAETYNGMTGMTDGAVYVDYATVPTVTTPTTSEGTGGEDITDPELVGKVENHITSDILTYKKIGPNNETYLGPQQLVAFQLLVFSKTLPNRLDIGAKAITDDPTMLSVKILDTKDGQDLAYTTTVQGPAQQYYNLYLEADAFTSTTIDGKKCHITTVIISNPRVKNTVNADKILSITDIRVGYKDTTVVYDPAIGTPTKRNADVELPEDEFVPVRFVVTSELGDIVNEALEEMYKPCTHTPGQWETIAQSGVGCSGIEQIRCTRCGEILETRITEEIPTPVFAGASVALQSDLTIYYKVKESAFAETGFTDPYVVICDNGTETVIRDYSVQNGSYSFAYRNIAPHRMGDTLTATLYATYNGQVYACQSKDYSVADYCYNMLSKTEGNDSYAKLRTLLVDILLYGAESQKYTNYKADTLCTARLTEDQLACGTAELTRELVNCRDQAYEVIDNPTVEWKGAGLNLRESVAVRFKISAESYEGLEVKITLEGRIETFKAEDFDYRTDGAYVHFTGLNAAQLSEPIYVAAFRDGVQVSNTICYSVESYAYSKQNDTTIAYLASLVERMMCYGDSARAYVGK